MLILREGSRLPLPWTRMLPEFKRKLTSVNAPPSPTHMRLAPGLYTMMDWSPSTGSFFCSQLRNGNAPPQPGPRKSTYEEHHKQVALKIAAKLNSAYRKRVRRCSSSTLRSIRTPRCRCSSLKKGMINWGFYWETIENHDEEA